jgi:phosphoglycolate phosphatase
LAQSPARIITGSSKVNILFDLDGTLTDSYEGITRCICHALETLGRTPPPRERLTWCIGPPLRKSFSLLLDTADEGVVAEALAAYRQRFKTVGMYENEVYGGVGSMLEALQQKGHTLFVATSKPAVFARRIVDHFGLDHFFRAVYGSGLGGELGDKKSLISHILTRENIEPATAAMVGDREHDMIGARENGVRGIGALWGYGTREELEASGACACVSAPTGLMPVIEQDLPQHEIP